jgi:RHS repeat-associated protein
MRWIFLLLGANIHLFAGPFDDITPSSPDEIASLNADLIVDGCVSAMSGQLALSEVDLHVRGTQDLLLKRTYVPPQVLGRYHDKDERDRLELGRALLQLNTKGWVCLPHLWAGYNQNSPYFQVRDPGGYVLEFEIQGNKGILKASPYGCSNLRSGEPSSAADIRNIEFLVEGTQVKVTWPDGTTRIYLPLLAGLYRLDREILPNGKAIRYHWEHTGLTRITSTDGAGRYTYASIDRVGDCHFRGSDGREVKLTYEAREIKGKNKKEGLKAKFQFPVMTRSVNPVYSNSVGYNERTLLTSYDALSYPISCSYSSQKGSLARIQTFSTPSSSISFSYDPPIAGQKGGSTTVSYPDGAVVVYRFNSSLLLSSLENWLGGKLYNQKIFTYDHKQHLTKVEIKDGDGNCLLTKVYECDPSGNPILETRKGDFGTFSIRRNFSKNRLIAEDRDDGLKAEYSYLGDTRLLLSKTTLMDGKPIRKTLYTYDDANNLIEEKEEGQTVTTYQLNSQGHHLHRTSFKEERDWDGNLIHKTGYAYNRFGNIAREDHYGSDGKFAYSIEKVYDEKGNLLEETNPLGQKATYTYDGRNRPIKEVPFSNRLSIERTFDGKGRIVHSQEGDHETRFSYNASDELIEKTDYLGLTTSYTYHPIHEKPTLIEAEPTLQEITYDAFGREVMRKNAYGATTQIKPNSYGDPLEIIHPDGGKETFQYGPNGLCLEEIDPDGLKTSYSYDPLGRLLSKRKGAYETNYFYDAYHLTEENDPMGISTFYTYNLAGQKVGQARAGVVTKFSYDSLGFLSSESRSGRKTTFENDVLGRVLEKNIDGVLKTAYTYDSSGNVASIANGNPVFFSYDPYDRLVEKINAEGEKTTFFYEEGDQVLTKRIVDPRGIETTELYNAHGLLLKKEIPGVFLEEFAYDKALRLISQDHLAFTYTPEGYLSSMCEAGKRTTYWTYTLGGKVQSKIKPDGTTIPYEYNSQGQLIRMGSREFRHDALDRLIQGSGFTRELDSFGNILREELSTGLILTSSYDDYSRPVQRILPDGSQILYAYEGPFLKTVTRLDSRGSPVYAHTYEEFDETGNLLLERGLFSTAYVYDKAGRRIFQKNPYFAEEMEYDRSGNLIRKGNVRYTYDAASQLISEGGKFQLTYDRHYNRTSVNGEEIQIDALNQRRDVEYDLNGNLVREGFVYDEFDQLVQTGTDHFTYDALGRRLINGSTAYFYIEDEEIGSFRNGQIEELKVLGATAPVAIEIKDKPFAPVVDVQNTTRHLVDWNAKEVAFENTCDAFGKGLSEEIPYAYVGKRYDASSGVVYFGKRFYDPSLGRWLTPDPLGAVDHSNLYQYVLNNPFRYYDPNGESLGGYLLGLGEIALGATIMAGGFALEVVTVGGFTIGLGVTTSTGAALMGLGITTTSYHAQDIKVPNISWKNTNVYAPDRPLPLTEDGIPIPETDVPHTQLGTRDGSKGKYPQAREFGKDGKPVKGIDFTDHGRPWDHPNPHEHPCEPNPTGGTPGRGNAKPLENWRY